MLHPVDELKLPPKNHSLTNSSAQQSFIAYQLGARPAGPRVREGGKKEEKWPVLGQEGYQAKLASAGQHGSWLRAGQRLCW